jgi:hypothetical protein
MKRKKMLAGIEIEFDDEPNCGISEIAQSMMSDELKHRILFEQKNVSGSEYPFYPRTRIDSEYKTYFPTSAEILNGKWKRNERRAMKAYRETLNADR